MTALHIEDDVYQMASEAAAARGMSVDAFVATALRQAASGAKVRRTIRNGLPVMSVDADVPPIDPEHVRTLVQENGF